MLQTSRIPEINYTYPVDMIKSVQCVVSSYESRDVTFHEEHQVLLLHPGRFGFICMGERVQIFVSFFAHVFLVWKILIAFSSLCSF
jgi:hypothetical protein